MAPSLKRISSPIDSAQWKLIRQYLSEKNEDEELSELEDEEDKDTSSILEKTNLSAQDESSNLWETVEETESDETNGQSSADETADNSRKLLISKSNNRVRRQETALSWLQNIQVATIPTFEFYVFAFKRRILALASSGEIGQWRIVFRKELPDSDATAVVCLPVAPTRVSDPRPFEWTAVLIGTSDGRLLALSERGDELLIHRFHTKPVIEMRLQSDQLFITYADYLTAVSSFTLLAAVKTSRQRIVRQHVSTNRLSDLQGNNLSPIDSQLVYEYWRLENIHQPTSAVATGPHRTSIWEKMVTASIKGGFNANISGRQPSYETYCATNNKSFVSFNWWTDETPPNLLAGIASKIKSSVSVPLFASSWWSSKSPSTNKQSDGSSTMAAAAITSRDVPQRSCLPDGGRMGERLILAPGNRLAAVCDDLGRVSILDIQRRLLLRMWKGYRDAQCSWIELPYYGKEKNDGDRNRCNVLCLVIFAPRRGILEIWSAQNGRRAAAFNVDRRGTLIYCPTTAMTKSNLIDFSKSTRFLDSNGHFFNIDISAGVVIEPHETSTYWTAPMKEDFRKRWKENFVDESSLVLVSDVLGHLVWIKDITYLIDRITQSSKIDCKLFIRFVDAAVTRLTKDNLTNEPETKSLCARCLAYRQITHFVALIAKFHETKFDSSSFDFGDSADVSRLLALRTVDDLHDLLRDLDANLKIRFASFNHGGESKNVDSSTILPKFLSSIDYRSLSGHGAFSPSGTTAPTIMSEQTLRLRFQKDVDDATILADLGDFVFKPFLVGCPAEEFRRNAQPLLGLIDRDWIRLCGAYWLHKNRSYSVHPERLYNLFFVLPTRNEVDEKLDGQFLKEIRRSIIDCSRIAEALSLCTVVRAMVKNTISIQDDSDWTRIEKNVEDWDILQNTLHGVLLIDTCCRNVIFDENRSSKTADFESISLRQLLLTGAGYLSEYVARSFVAADRSVTVGDLSGDTNSETSWANSLRRARELLPSSLETERLILGILWEYVRVWYQTRFRSDCLSKARNLIDDVQDERLRQGFASLAWRTFFCEHYEKLCTSMMQSNGKDCGEIFEKETGLQASSMLEFVRFAYALFNCMKESVERWQLETASNKYETEEFLNNFFAAFRRDVSDERSANRESLWELLSRQPTNSQSKIDLHWQLTASILVAMSTNFETRLTPLSLFSWDERADLFKSLAVDDSKLESKLSDDDAEQQQLDNRRLLFLLSYVTVAIKSSLPSIKDGTSEKNLLPDLSLAVKLARAWGLNFDAIRRQEVVQLYLAGFPDLASKLMPLVEERRQLASTLLDIAGCSLSDRWSTSQTKIRPNMSSALWTWLTARKSSTNARGPELSLDACASMLDYVSSTMSPQTSEYKTSNELRSVIEKLK